MFFLKFLFLSFFFQLELGNSPFGQYWLCENVGRYDGILLCSIPCTDKRYLSCSGFHVIRGDLGCLGIGDTPDVVLTISGVLFEFNFRWQIVVSSIAGVSIKNINI